MKAEVPKFEAVLTEEEEAKLRSEAEIECLKYNHDGKVIVFIDYFID